MLVVGVSIYSTVGVSVFNVLTSSNPGVIKHQHNIHHLEGLYPIISSMSSYNLNRPTNTLILVKYHRTC